MKISIPELAVVALVGVSGSGKSTFAKRHFLHTEVLSSDVFRGMVSDDENDQSATRAAFDTLYYVANKRLEAGRLTVIDATNVQKEARERVLSLAKEQDCHAVAIVLDVGEQTCRARNAERPDRNFGAHVIVNQQRQLQRSIRHLQKEGFRYVYVLKSPEDVEAAEMERVPLWNNKKTEMGPFDIIGDIHGCYAELRALLVSMGYAVDDVAHTATPPEGRRAVFLGDLCDRGPENVRVLRLVMHMVQQGHALCVAGNHDEKLLRYLRGKKVQMAHGLEGTVAEIKAQGDAFASEVQAFLEGLISHYVLSGGKLVVAHAGLKERYQGRGSGRVRSFCLYGETTGETDEYGMPVRLPWADAYRGQALVVYGHTPVPEVQLHNNTACIDTGCVFGGKLTAFRYPERETVQVAAAREYYAPARPFLAVAEEPDDMLTIEDVQGVQHIQTKLRRAVRVQAENAAAALEVMSRFAADPHWLIYLPPTMSPCETSQLPGYLEHPAEAFAYYKNRGVGRAVIEQKHMGSRAVIVLCRDENAAKARFAVRDGSRGIVYTRTGRHFFDDANQEAAVLSRLEAVLTKTGFWEAFSTDWVCLDTELMPWSAKAQRLISQQYAPVGLAGRVGLERSRQAVSQALDVLAQAGEGIKAEPNADLLELLTQCEQRGEAISQYVDAYRQYCWPVTSVDDLRIAPFHMLATEGHVYADKTHSWHMDMIRKYMTGEDDLFMATEHAVIDLLDDESIAQGVAWWERLTASGGEGMVVKPHDFIAFHGRELLQPAVKCRGREYLRIIYGPEYTLLDHLDRLRKRGLMKKRTLALNEFALGQEGLERFVRREPLHRVHACAFGVLALESEPVDPRL